MISEEPEHLKDNPQRLPEEGDDAADLVVAERFRIGTGLKWLDRAAYGVSSFMFLAFTGMVTWNVFSRNVFDRPVPWAEESGITVLVLMVFVIQLSLEVTGDQLSVGLLTNMVKSDVFRRIHLVIRGLITIAVFGLLGRAGYHVIQQNLELESKTPVVGVPLAYIFGTVAVVMWLLIVVWILILGIQAWKAVSHE